MKKSLVKVALALVPAVRCFADDALPTTAPTSPSHQVTSAADSRFGAGLMIGEPTGPTIKYWLTDTLALDAAAGWSFRDDATAYAHADVLWHLFDLIPVSHDRLPVYFGVGSLVRFRDHHRDDEFGLRLPIGVSYKFERSPLEVFAEVAPGVDLTPTTRADFTGGIGLRYWF